MTALTRADISLVKDTFCSHLPSREQLSLFLQLLHQSTFLVDNTLQLYCLIMLHMLLLQR